MLPALLLERLLRLFDLVASTDVSVVSIGRILLDLVPHYLGLALPAALFIGVQFVIAKLSAENELDAIQSAGFSLTWISRPFILIGVVVAFVGFGLYGYVQPYARYAYRAAYQAATEGTWNATIPAQELTRVSKNLVVTADRSGPAGRLTHVFVYERRPDGGERLSTGRSGTLVLSADGKHLLLKLDDAEQLQTTPDGHVDMLTSRSTTMRRPYLLQIAAFRPRGVDEREMTMGELWSALSRPDPPEPRRRLDGELYSRIVRSLSLAVLPLLALPIGLAAKRARRQYGIVVGVLILVVYDHAIQLAQSLGTADLIDPRLPLCAAFAAFFLFSLGLFHHAGRHTSEGPFDPMFEALEQAADRCKRLWQGGLWQRRTEPGD